MEFEQKTTKIKEDFKNVYLTLYNLFMFVGFMYIVCVLCISYMKEGPNFFSTAYDTVGPTMCLMQLLQCLEIMHPIFGYVRGGWMMPFLQVLGRLFVLFLMIEREPRVQKMPVVFYLFLIWSTIEIIRYPYYLSQLYKTEIGFLSWLRYTAWMILYPVGFTCEGVVVFRNLIFVESSKKWSIAMPNPINFTFHFATFLRIYLLFIMLPAMYILMTHMYKMRKIKLGTNASRMKSKKA